MALPIRTLLALAVTATALAAACGGSPAAPTSTIDIAFATPVRGQVVTCGSCTTAPKEWVAAEFPVTVTADAAGSVASVTVIVRNRSRGSVEMGRNVRPNKDSPYPDTRVPARGSLTVGAGIVYFPPPAAEEDVVVDVTVRLEDGRSTSRSGTIVAARPEP